MALLQLTDQNFHDTLSKAKMPMLVDFWAPWCGPCKIIGPIVDELAEKYVGKIEVGKVNVDDNPEVSGEFGIMSIPTLAFFKNGQIVKTVIGAQPKEALQKAIDEVLAM